MTTFEAATVAEQPSKPGFITRFIRAIERNRLERAQHRILLQLSHYDAHLLRDIGIDPRDVEAALNRQSLSILLHPVRPGGR